MPIRQAVWAPVTNPVPHLGPARGRGRALRPKVAKGVAASSCLPSHLRASGGRPMAEGLYRGLPGRARGHRPAHLRPPAWAGTWASWPRARPAWPHQPQLQGPHGLPGDLRVPGRAAVAAASAVADAIIHRPRCKEKRHDLIAEKPTSGSRTWTPTPSSRPGILVTTDPAELGANCMEGLEPGWNKRIGRRTILVAAHNFGCGSSREHAPIRANQGRGFRCWCPSHLSRIFYRNGFNMGAHPPGGGRRGGEAWGTSTTWRWTPGPGRS